MHFTKFIILICFIVRGIRCLSYDIIFTKFEVMPETDTTFLDFGTLRILKKNRQEVEFSGRFSVFKKLTNVGIVTISSFRLNKLGMPPLQVFYSNGGYCDLVSADPDSYANVVAHSDLPDEYCPLQPGNYTLKDLTIHLDKFPDAIPLGDYIATMTYSLNSVIKFGYKMTVEIIAANNRD